MRLLAKSHGVEYVSMIDLFCSDIYCAVADATGSPLLFDGEHFTMNGSLYAAKRLTDVAAVGESTAPGWCICRYATITGGESYKTALLRLRYWLDIVKRIPFETTAGYVQIDS